MKKRSRVLLVVIMILAMFTACGGGNSGSNVNGGNDANMEDDYLDLDTEYNAPENNANDSEAESSKVVLEGAYWLHEEEVFRTGFIMDGNGKYRELRNGDLVEGTYEMLDVYESSEGIEYSFTLDLDGMVEERFLIISTDGKIYVEPFVYAVVDEETFYGKEEETTPGPAPTIKYAFEGKYFIMKNTGSGQMMIFFDGANAHCKYEVGGTQLIPYTFDGVNTITFTGGYEGTFTYDAASETLYTDMMSGQTYVLSDKATFDAFGN